MQKVEKEGISLTKFKLNLGALESVIGNFGKNKKL